MKKVICIMLLSLFVFQTTLVKSADNERQQLNAIIEKTVIMRRVMERYINGTALDYDGETLRPLTPAEKTLLINKYNTLKAELKVLVEQL